MKTKSIYLIALLSLLITSFQNCSGPQASNGSLTLEQIANTTKALGLYNLDDIGSIHYTYTQSLNPMPPPNVYVTFNGINPSVSASFQGLPQGSQPAQDCTVNSPLSSADIVSFRAALLGASVSNAPVTPLMVISDCSLESLEVIMKDTSKHTYYFQSECTYNGELSIVDPGSKLEQLLGSYAQHSCLTQ